MHKKSIKSMEVFYIKENGLELNEEIRDQQVRLIDDDGSQLGMYSAKDAQKLAIEKGLDLVKIAPKATPPVCKIMDYKKYLYEQEKKEKEAKKRQKTIEVKEIQLTIRIEENDLKTKVNHAIRFLKNGDKVKVVLKFRGREMSRPELGYELLDKFADLCSEYGNVGKKGKLEGRNIIMIIESKPLTK